MNFASSSHALPHLLHKLLTEGTVQKSRNGETRELTMQHVTIDQTVDPYMVTPGRRASLPAQIAETMWVLAGRDDVKWLSHYLPQAAKFSDDGMVWRGAYGPRLRKWSGSDRAHGKAEKHDTFDQLQHVVNLLTDDPDTRRAVINIYDPASDSLPGKDVPCNNWVHFLARDGVLHAHVAVRSNDVMWGWSGINVFEWSVLNQVVASRAGLAPGSLTFDISSLHLYERHYDKAQRIVDQTLLADNDLDAGMWEPDYDSYLPPFEMPQNQSFDSLVDQWFILEGAVRTGNPGALTAVDSFPEPMLREWLRALHIWWNHVPLRTRPTLSIEQAYIDSPQARGVADSPRLARQQVHSSFMRSVDRLHRDKGAVYGISWRKRGETFSILPNIGRKIDRLGVGGAGDSEADTYVDLTVYLAKYRQFLLHGVDGWDDNLPAPCDDPDRISEELQGLDSSGFDLNPQKLKQWTAELKDLYEDLLKSEAPIERRRIVDGMLTYAWACAKYVATQEGWTY